MCVVFYLWKSFYGALKRREITFYDQINTLMHQLLELSAKIISLKQKQNCQPIEGASLAS